MKEIWPSIRNISHNNLLSLVTIAHQAYQQVTKSSAILTWQIAETL